jgi:hypothetical protein
MISRNFTKTRMIAILSRFVNELAAFDEAFAVSKWTLKPKRAEREYAESTYTPAFKGIDGCPRLGDEPGRFFFIYTKRSSFRRPQTSLGSSAGERKSSRGHRNTDTTRSGTGRTPSGTA